MAIQPLAFDLLRTDHVLTDAQLARFGLNGSAFPGLTLTVRPMNDSLVEREVTFRALRPETLESQIHRLPHYAGTAAIRHQLGGEQWVIDKQGSELAPDAVWEVNGQRVAVEYDAGYRPKDIRRKMAFFREAYDQTVWATPSALRTARMQAKYPDVRVLTVDYWTPPRIE